MTRTATSIRIEEIQTPALLVEESILRGNVARMEARCRELGVRHRLHVKTAKCAEIARLGPSSLEHGITVSTVKEAECFAAEGFRDILYAVGIVEHKIPRLARLARNGVRVLLAVDSRAAVAMASRAAEREGVRFEVLLEVDCGEHRSGLDALDPDLVPVGRAIQDAAGLALAGVFTHGGHAYEERTPARMADIAEQERRAVVTARDQLLRAGLPCPVVSVGSTPTLTHARSLEGVTEARAGVYVFQDLFQWKIGTCSLSDIAATVLTAVIGHQRHGARLLVDAGGLALSKDRSTAALGAEDDCGYGLLMDSTGRSVIPGLRIVEAYQEHGVVEGDPPIDFSRFPLGTRLRILPNHACMTASQYDRYHLTAGERFTSVWPRIHEWV